MSDADHQKRNPGLRGPGDSAVQATPTEWVAAALCIVWVIAVATYVYTSPNEPASCGPV